MKKFLAIIMAIAMLATMLCIPTFAAGENADAPAPGVVLRISALKNDGKTVKIADYKVFEDGWNAAMELANDMEDYDYTRVIVDIYADWIAYNGSFTDDGPAETNGPGFYSDNIYFNDDVKMTLNMNGHTIDADHSSPIRNGEVIYIDTYADVIINDGTITGGKSFNGAGGIHINDGAKVTLNNVNVIGNLAWEDDGGGIALYGGASLVMNGGSLKDNQIWHDYLDCYGGAIYAKDSSVTLNNVEIKNNVTKEGNDYGAAIYADESTVVLNGCTVEGNGKENDENKYYAAISIIHAVESSVTIKGSTLKGNGSLYYNKSVGPRNTVIYSDVSTLIFLDESTLIMEGGNNVTGNYTGHLIKSTDESEFFISDTNFVLNSSTVLYSSEHEDDSYFNNCTFNNNSSYYISKEYSFASHIFITRNAITFYDCSMGNSTYSNLKFVKFVNQELESGTVITVSALKADGTIVKIDDYRSFESGWSIAMSLSNDIYWMRANDYTAVVVDLRADWIATLGKFNDDFMNDIGFASDTILIPESASVVLNMNGHTINRGLTESKTNGEVICIMPSANVTINDGTITGGFSSNGAGGIHINDDAQVTLNNVNVIGNKAEDADGAAIAAHDGAILIMNGGSISNNEMHTSEFFWGTSYGTLYLNRAKASLKDVEITNNIVIGYVATWGTAIYVDDGNLKMENCNVKNNGYRDSNRSSEIGISIICLDKGVIDIKGGTFENNGTPNTVIRTHGPYLIDIYGGGVLKMDGVVFRNNESKNIFYCKDGSIEAKKCQFYDNFRGIFVGAANAGSHFTECKFSDNTKVKDQNTFYFEEGNQLEFTNCDLGDSTFNDRSLATFDGAAGVGSIFGEGSITNILMIISFAASATAIFLVVYYNKKKAAPTANGAAKSDDEE